MFLFLLLMLHFTQYKHFRASNIKMHICTIYDYTNRIYNIIYQFLHCAYVKYMATAN